MPLHPIIKSLGRHRAIALLLLIQLSFTFAIVCNVALLVFKKSQEIGVQTGLTEAGLYVLRNEYTGEGNVIARQASDLQALRSMPGVTSVVAMDSLPLSRDNWLSGYATGADTDGSSQGIVAQAQLYNGTAGIISTLGLSLLEGRDFGAADAVPMDTEHDYAGEQQAGGVILSEPLAQKYFGKGAAVGRYIYASQSHHPLRVVGVVRRLARSTLSYGEANGDAMILPLVPDSRAFYLVIRATEGQDGLLTDAKRRLLALDRGRIFSEVAPYRVMRRNYFKQDSSMLQILLLSGLALVAVTTMGIAGLVSFWVQQRRKQIGIRRALGASKRAILGHFLFENSVMVIAGMVFGSLLAYGLNTLIRRYFEGGWIPGHYLLLGALLLWLLSQFAVFFPAFKASRTPPMVVMRG